VNIGTKGDIFVLTEDQRHELMRVNREFLESAPLPEHDGIPHNGNLPALQYCNAQPERLTLEKGTPLNDEGNP